jgi:hypothetical protein
LVPSPRLITTSGSGSTSVARRGCC